MTNFRTAFRTARVAGRHLAIALAAAALASACAPKHAPSLTALCAGSGAVAHVSATVDTVRPAAGAELAAAKGTAFELAFEFAPGRRDSASATCAASQGTASFSGALPDRIRGATASTREATWRIEGDTVLLDLNPGTRDNNVFVVLPLDGGRGHWGLSTFAGEVASGATTAAP